MILDENAKGQKLFPLPTEWNSRYSNKPTFRPRFMSAADYVFYLRRHLTAERRKNDPDVGYPGDESMSIGIPRLSYLLRRLQEDIQSSYTSFVEEFASDLHDGIGCLLGLLRTCHNRRNEGGHLPYSDNNRKRQSIINKGTVDELFCLLCLKAACQCMIAVDKVADHENGLSTLATCIISTHMKSRIVAIELLTTVCGVASDGVHRVLEAMTTARMIFGESVRFKFLVSMLNSNFLNSSGFETVTLIFLNTLLEKCPRMAERIRIQCELEEAGLVMKELEKQLREKTEGNNNRVWNEIYKWYDLQVDLEKVLQKYQENMKLRKEVTLLRKAFMQLQSERKGIVVPKEIEELQSSTEDSPVSERSENDGSSTTVQMNSLPDPDIHDSELEEIVIDIPTIKADPVLELKESISTNDCPPIPPPLPPPLPPLPPKNKNTDSGVGSSVWDSDMDPDLCVDWYYPELPGVRFEKRQSSVHVRFSSETFGGSVGGETAKDIPKIVVLPPGKNKIKCADICGIQNTPRDKKNPTKGATNSKKAVTALPGKSKPKGKHALNKSASMSMTYKTSSKHNGKLWNFNLENPKVKYNLKNIPIGSSMNGMIHREIAKAIRERNALFEI